MKTISRVTATWIAILLAVPIAATAEPTSIQDAQMQTLFSRSGDYLARTSTLCQGFLEDPDQVIRTEAQACMETTKEATGHLARGREAFGRGSLSASDRREFAVTHVTTYYAKIQNELNGMLAEEMQNGNLSLKEPPARGLLEPAMALNCDQMMVIATAICSLYAAGGPAGIIAAAACEAASIVGYVRCIAAQKEDPSN